ncbi:antitoxin VapB family protein [Roseimicrobium sp. ORNL1]|uniref:antitoxin VapB family protein n=1 Tax=Roseimicrobium sp. ORNL1 TaxID=2711231 RepID=UPI0013E16845|nr:antitoxin VapB family protein [Roseimicrobium sp. ORNL1]QIF05926.1 hypothetical protein G5S37_32045 [Roseimicrobium sp. ORNL1]
MATKTITLELDAYEKLRAAKRNDRESFSMVVRRAIWPDAPMNGEAILAYLQNRPFHFSEEDLDHIEAADKADVPPKNPWDESNP